MNNKYRHYQCTMKSVLDQFKLFIKLFLYQSYHNKNEENKSLVLSRFNYVQN